MAKFRLGRIIEIKSKLMDDKKNELEAAKAELYRVETDIGTLRSEVNDNYENMSGRFMEGSDFSVLMDYIYSLEVKRDGLMEEKNRIIERIDGMKAELFELAKEIKMFDKLKSKAFQVEKKQSNRKEQKILDEIALRTEERKL
jgi:flagellar export protein FliJ